MKLIEVRPGDVTLVTGQPLEITAIAEGPDSPDARLIFDNPALGDRGERHRHPRRCQPASLFLSRRARRSAHAYRVEVGATQSPWFTVTLVKQVKLTALSFHIQPPAYTKLTARDMDLKADQIGSAPVSVPQGSDVQLAASVDVPVNGAMLQLGHSAPSPCALKPTAGSPARSMSWKTRLCRSSSPPARIRSSLRCPKPPLVIHCTADAAPQIEMKWPAIDSVVAPNAEIHLAALLRDDYGLSDVKILMGVPEPSSANTQAAPDAGPLMDVAYQQSFNPAQATVEFSHVLDVKPELRKHGLSIFVQLQATDNRDLSALIKEGGPQTVSSARYEIKFRDPQQIAKEEKEKNDRLRKKLMALLKQQQDLHEKTVAWKTGQKDDMGRIASGQTDLRCQLVQTAESFEFDADTRIVQKTLLVLAYNPAKDAVDLATSIAVCPAPTSSRA